MSVHPPSQRRLTVGFLLASLHTGASRAVLPGFLETAEKMDVNLICFPGGRLRVLNSFENQRNSVFQLASEHCVDGLVSWASSLGGVLTTQEINAFHEQYQPLPIVSLAQFMEGIPTVSVDSYHSLRALLNHLIEDHGFTRLAFIRGPEVHYNAQERYRAYLDSLQSHHLPFTPELVTRPLRWESGEEAIQILLDERGLIPGKDFQAVVAVSDLMAIWALKTLQNRGFNVPRDVAVTGFNNSIEERLATPPLTTVESPFYLQSARALEVLLARCAGKTIPALTTLPSHLVIRQSCGCPSDAVAQASYEPTPEQIALARQSNLLETRASCLNEMAAAAGFSSGLGLPWVEPVYDAWMQDFKQIQKGSHHGLFLTILETQLDHAMHEKMAIPPWHNVLSVLRRWILPHIAAEDRGAVETIFGQARVVISEQAQRSEAYWKWQVERQLEHLRETSRSLLTTFDIQGLADVLYKNLPELGIPSAYLALYNDPTFEQARLVLAYTENGRFPLEAGGRRYPACQVVPPDLLPQNRRYSLVVEPLFFQEKSIGFVVFEIGPRDVDVYERLRESLSSAIQGAFLFEEIQQARLSAEKADQIKTRLLANVSHELRTPLNIILNHTQIVLENTGLDPALMPEIQHIRQSAEHQLRIINDLLDLSRAQIDELDLNLELIQPQPLLKEAFQSIADLSPGSAVAWEKDIPERLPLIKADAVRLRQMILNLLSNARKFTESGKISLGAQVVPPHLHIWVADTGWGIPATQQERIFEPFVTMGQNRRITGGIGLGLSITRHLVALHGGKMSLDSAPNVGSTFHIYLPLPALDEDRSEQRNAQPVLLLISGAAAPAPEIAAIGSAQHLNLIHVHSLDELEAILSTTRPQAVAWDLSQTQTGDWNLIRRLKHHPNVSQVPFILYGHHPAENAGSNLSLGLTSFVSKRPGQKSILEAIQAVCSNSCPGLVLIVDDDMHIRAAHQALVQSSLPNNTIRTAADGAAALAIMEKEVPALVLLDLVMPQMSGMDVLDVMRADPRLRQVPVIVLSNKLLNLEDVKRIELHTRVTFQSKGVWSEEEAAAALERALSGVDNLPAHSSALVKRVILYLHQNYARPLSRWEIASAIGMSEDYLTRLFNRELGISPWEYLNRYRILQAKTLLATTELSISAVAHQVGFKDPPYFTRVFTKIVGVSPQVFRKSSSAPGDDQPASSF